LQVLIAPTACWLVLAGFAANQCLAASTVVSTGFEPPTFTTGNLQGQGGWVTAGAGASTAVVQNSIVNSGSQAVQVTKAAAANSDRRWAVPVNGYPVQRFIIVDWDMRVTQASIQTGFGPFFGVDTYDADTSPYVLGSLGVDATTGDVLFQQQNTGELTETGTLAAFNQWNHFRLILDFGTDTYRGYFNGTQVANTGFVDGVFGLDNFTDADIATFAAAADPVSQSVSASAVFDNFMVRDGLSGDYNNDGTVDTADYTLWRSTFGNSVVTGKFADGNKDGIINTADYVLWRDNLNASIFTGSGAAIGSGTAVPEPASWMALVAGVVIVSWAGLSRHRPALAVARIVGRSSVR
jgi:dockerin type I repeat protein